MKINGTAIYGTEAFPIEGLSPGMYATRRGNQAFLILFHWPDTDRLKLKNVSLASANLLTAEGPQPVRVEQGNTLTGLAPEPPNGIASVIALQLK